MTQATVTVRATRRGMVGAYTFGPGDVFQCAVKDLALEEDHPGTNGWMVLQDPEELLPLLPADEAALWKRRRAALARGATSSHDEAHNALLRLRESRNPPNAGTTLKA
jgi:hypothetical protein